MSSDQKLVDILFDIALTVHNRRDYFDGKTNEEVAQWAAKQLQDCGFPTTPVGMSWGVLQRQPIEYPFFFTY